MQPVRASTAGTPRLTTVGNHLIADISGCKASLTDYHTIILTLRDACEAAGATVVGSTFHQFPNGAVSGVVLLAESHVSIHTWPERNYAAVDVYTCGDIKTGAVLNAIVRGLEGCSYQTFIERGIDREEIFTHIVDPPFFFAREKHD